MKNYLFSILMLLTVALQGQNITLNGYVSSADGNEPIPYAYVRTADGKQSTLSNAYGFYTLSLTTKSSIIIVSAVGYIAFTDTITTEISQKKNYHLNSQSLDEVIVTANRNNSTDRQTGTTLLTMQDIKTMPLAGFQRDILKTLQFLPGVSGGNEGMSALLVRGGSNDQNLVMIDGVPLYHYTHLEGLLSSFSTEAVKSMKLIQSGFPAKYSGRLSSVLDIRLKDGNADKFKGSANIGLLSTGFTIDGPIVKMKSSYMLSARGFTLQPLVMLFPYAVRDNFFGGYGFYDLFSKINTKIGDKDKIYVSFYIGKDKRQSNGLFEPEYTTRLGNLQTASHWTHQWSNRIFSNFSAYISRFETGNKAQYFSLGEDETVENLWADSYSLLTESGVKWDFEYNAGSKITLNYGTDFTYYSAEPSAVNYRNIAQYHNYTPPVYSAHIAGAYLSGDFTLSNIFSVSAGFRTNLSFFAESVKLLPEPRAIVVCKINNYSSVKAAFSTMHQQIHAISYSAIALKNVYYLPSNSKITPSKSNQYNLGYYLDTKHNINFEVEVFYKIYSNLAELNETALISDIHEDWYDKIEGNGVGTSKGISTLFTAKLLKQTVRISYTLSNSVRQFPNINNGAEFPFDYDRKHDFSYSLSGKLNPKWNYNIAWYYKSGTPFTSSDEIFMYPNEFNFGYEEQLDFTSFRSTTRNNAQFPDYHRLDISVERVVFKGKQNKTMRTLSFGVYNVYNRKNPSYYTSVYNETDGTTTLVPKTFFPFIPHISYSIEF